MAKKKNEDPWWWVEGLGLDSYGIATWNSIFNCRDEKEAKMTLRMIERSDAATRARSGVSDRYIDFRIAPPGSRPSYEEWAKERTKAEERALKGYCPRCSKKPGKHKTGRWKGRRALKCSRCGHVWGLPGTHASALPSTKPSKAPSGKSKGSGAKKKSKKARKKQKRG